MEKRALIVSLFCLVLSWPFSRFVFVVVFDFFDFGGLYRCPVFALMLSWDCLATSFSCDFCVLSWDFGLVFGLSCLLFFVFVSQS
jgi:hypothetical protein